jgi:GxxExxY protein
MKTAEENRALTDSIIGAAIEVHRALGPGLLETMYAECMCHELSLRNHTFRREVDIPLLYKGVRLANPFRLDLIVAEEVIVELKSVAEVTSVHEAQLLTYLRLSGIRIGLLLNFNVAVLRDGITRRVL